MTPEQRQARAEYVRLAGPTIGGQSTVSAPALPEPVTRTAPQPRIITDKQPQASTSSSYPYTTGWPTSMKPAGAKSRRGIASYHKQLVLDRRALQNNNRVAVHDSPAARLVLRRQVETTIGAGIKVNFTPNARILGITEEEAEEIGEDLSNRFHIWASSKDSDITGDNTFYQNQGFWGWGRWRDGDVFPRLNYNFDDQTLLSPLQIGFIDPNQIAGDEFTFNSGPIPQDDGLIKDKNGKTIGFKVWVQDENKPLSTPKLVPVPARDTETGLPIMLHGFNKEYAGQRRGIPEMAHAIQWFERIEDFDINTATKMSNSAALNFTVENAFQDPSDAGFASLDSGVAAGIERDISVSPPSVDTGLSAEQIFACNLPESTLTEPGVNMLASRQGDKIKLIESAAPPEGSNEYLETKFNILSATGGMAPEMVKMLFTKSHSASRASMGLQAAIIKIRVADMDADFIKDVIFAWTFLEIAAGRVQLPGFSDPILREAWLMHTLDVAPLPDVDPETTRKAVRMALEDGLTNYDRAAKEYNNSDGKANRRKITRQIAELPAPPPKAANVSISETTTVTEDDED